MTTARDFCRAVNPSAYLADDVKRWDIDEIRDAMIADGSHWWDTSTIRYFQSRIGSEVFQGIGGIFFVTSERDRHAKYNTQRAYTVRQFNPATLSIGNGSEFQEHPTRTAAHRHAKRLSTKQIPKSDTVESPPSSPT